MSLHLSSTGVRGGAALWEAMGRARPPQPLAVPRAKKTAGRAHLVLIPPTCCPGAPAGKLCSRHWGLPIGKTLIVPCRPCENEDPDFVDREWGLRVYISNQFPSDVEADGGGHKAMCSKLQEPAVN